MAKRKKKATNERPATAAVESGKSGQPNQSGQSDQSGNPVTVGCIPVATGSNTGDQQAQSSGNQVPLNQEKLTTTDLIRAVLRSCQNVIDGKEPLEFSKNLINGARFVRQTITEEQKFGTKKSRGRRDIDL